MSIRVENWPQHLADFIESRLDTPFAWGTHDCCLFTCDAIRAMSEGAVDPAEGVSRGKYSSLLGAMRILKHYGGVEAMADVVCQQQGFLETPIAFAQRGWPVLVDISLDGEVRTVGHAMDASALGICVGAEAAFPSSPKGLAFIKIEKCRKTWRVD